MGNKEEKNPTFTAEGLTLYRGSGGQRRRILRKVSLAISQGEILLIKGPSGVGKSSLLWALARMLPLEEGRLFLEGRPSEAWPAPLWRKEVSLVMQKHAMIPGTVKENLLFPWKLKIHRIPQEQGPSPRNPEIKDDQLREELNKVGLEDVDLKADAFKLSLGQTARLSLIRSILTRPACLLLDEPFAALDPKAAKQVLNRMYSFIDAGGAMVITGHAAVMPENSRALWLEKENLKEMKS